MHYIQFSEAPLVPHGMSPWCLIAGQGYGEGFVPASLSKIWRSSGEILQGDPGGKVCGLVFSCFLRVTSK